MAERSKWTDERVEQIIGNLLRAGVILSALVVAAGGCLYLVRHGNQPVQDRRVFEPEEVAFRSPIAIVRSAWSLRSGGLIQFGLLLLIATPVARVVFSVVAFALERDRLYVVITLVVLTILIYSLFSGHLH